MIMGHGTNMVEEWDLHPLQFSRKKMVMGVVRQTEMTIATLDTGAGALEDLGAFLDGSFDDHGFFGVQLAQQ
jgi:hypothetical protein